MPVTEQLYVTTPIYYVNDQPHLGRVFTDWASEYARPFHLLDLRRAAEAALLPVREVDACIDRTQSFRMAKEDHKLPAVGTVLHQCAETSRIASVLLWPFIPDACEFFRQRIGCLHYTESLANNGTGDLDARLKWGQLSPGISTEKGAPLFPRHQEEKGSGARRGIIKNYEIPNDKRSRNVE